MKKRFCWSGMIALCAAVVFAASLEGTSHADDKDSRALKVFKILTAPVVAPVMATAAGTAVTMKVAADVSNELDRDDQDEADRAYNDCLRGDVNRSTEWHTRHDNSESYGRYTVTEEYISFDGFVCRSFFEERWINGHYFPSHGHVCTDSFGNWIRISDDDYHADFVRRRNRAEMDPRVTPRMHSPDRDEHHHHDRDRDWDHDHDRDHDRGHSGGRTW